MAGYSHSKHDHAMRLRRIDGHLVALRAGGLAYLHVHPDGTTEPGPGIVFHAEVPSAGDYRLFLDFQHEGEVRTADFTLHAGEPQAPMPVATGHSH